MQAAPTKSQVNRAGDTLRAWVGRGEEIDDRDVDEANATVRAFRAGFQGPLTKVVMSMRSFMGTEGLEVLVAQRLKRGITIVDKLADCPR